MAKKHETKQTVKDLNKKVSAEESTKVKGGASDPTTGVVYRR